MITQPASKDASTAGPIDSLRNAFDGSIETSTASPLYHLGLLLASFMMTLLPLLYLAIILGVGYLTYWHASHHLTLFSSARSAGTRFRLLLYISPILVGVILLLFLTKPLFARRVRRASPRSVDRNSEPLLFAFVEQICHAVRSPMPRRIDVDCQVNASAGFRRGLCSMLGRDLVLTIGLPLAAGMSTRQLAGVVAHEMGHFAQGAAMRLSYLIRSINGWFARLVYERDEWDEKLADLPRRLGAWAAVLGYLSLLFVWLTRAILWLLMMAGHAVSSFLMRQMEYDADRHEVRLVGSDALRKTLLTLNLLSAASQAVYHQLGESWKEGRLGDDLPGMIVGHARRMSADARKNLEELALQSTTRWFDTHPCHSSRIRSVEAEMVKGIFHLKTSATALFSDFRSLSRVATLDHYRSALGGLFTPQCLVSSAKLEQRQKNIREYELALLRFVQGAFYDCRPVRLGDLPADAPADTRAVLAALQVARKFIQLHHSAAIEAYQRLTESDARVAGSSQARLLVRFGVKVNAEAFHLKGNSAEDIEQTLVRARSQHESASTDVRRFEEAVGSRLSSALQLLRAPSIAARVGQALALAEESAMLAECLRRLSESLDEILALRHRGMEVDALLSHFAGREEDEAYINQVQASLRQLRQQMNDLRRELSDCAYPFEHGQANATIGRYLIEYVPELDDVGRLLAALAEIVERALTLYRRIFGRLAQIAELAETAAGFPLLPDAGRNITC